MPIDPSFAVAGSEWEVGGIQGLGAEAGTPGAAQAPDAAQPQESFGDMLANQVESLTARQNEAAEASRSLVEGTATDPSQVVMAVERARLSMQLASQIRTKAVEAYQDVFHTQV